MADGSIDTSTRKRKYRPKGSPPSACSVAGCNRSASSKGMCPMHYVRWIRHGNTEGILDFGNPLDRFHKKYVVNKETACWEWSCYRHPKGYGILAIGKRMKVRAHRFAYEQLVGPIPDGMGVLHRCDNRRCVNPGHLFLGTDADNVRDMWSKGRGVTGARRLSWAMVTAMRVLYARGQYSFTELADIYRIDEEHARKIVKGERWLTPPG